MAYTFNGTDEALEWGTGVGQTGAGDFVTGAWVRTASTDGGALTMQRSSSQATNAMQLRMINSGADNSIRFLLFGDSSFQWDINSSSDYNDDVWHFVLGRRTSSAADIIVDGTQDGVDNTPGSDNMDDLLVQNIYNERDNNIYLAGELAHVVYWDADITDTVIGALSRGVNPFPIYRTNQLLIAPLDGHESPEVDYSPNRHSGTFVNSPSKFAGNPPVEHMENYI